MSAQASAASAGSPKAPTASPKVQEILGGISDPALRDQVDGAVSRCLEAMATLGRVHLPQDEFELKQDDDVDGQHLELAPYVLSAVASINRLLTYLMETFPPPGPGESDEIDFDDFDMEFDLIDGPTGGGGLSSHHAKNQTSPAEQAADAAHAFGGMLRSRTVSFGERLQRAHVSGDSWKLLAELDDYKHRLVKSVQGVLFGILSVFNNTASREEILPEYRSAVSEAVNLRTAITDLSYHIGRFNESLTDPDIAVPLMVGVSDRLTRFTSDPVYRSLRAEDKKAIIDFRRDLYSLRHNRDADGNVSMTKLRYAVEGFSKFLESMQAINHREVLVLHDRNLVNRALGQLAEITALARQDTMAAREALDGVVASLETVTGRNPELDRALREVRDREEPATVAADLQVWVPLLQQTAAMIG